jgi:sRNA-binding regulator protein Hfq
MIKKYLSIALICWLLVTANSMLISAQSQADKTASSIAKVKTAVLKRKTGENKRVKVIMLNGTDLKGYISQAGQDSFELTDSKTKQSSSIFYRDVKKVRGNGLSKTAIISLGGIGAAAAVVLYIVLAPICNEGGC